MKRPSKDSWAMIGIALTLTAVAVLVVYKPQQQKLSAAKDAAAKLKAALAADAGKAAAVPTLASQVQELRSRYKNFDRRLPKTRDFEGPLKEISASLAAERLANPSIQPGNGWREQLFSVQAINMQFAAPYLSLASFLKRIDSMERVTRVQKLVLSSDPKSKNLKVQVQLNIYHQG